MKPLLAIALVAATLTIGTEKPTSAAMSAGPAIHQGETDAGIVQQVGHRYYGNRRYGYRNYGYRNYGYRNYGYGTTAMAMVIGPTATMAAMATPISAPVSASGSVSNAAA